MPITNSRHLLRGGPLFLGRIEDFRRVKDDDETDDTELYVLSDRETEILELIAKGMRNKEIANHLSIAEKTVKNHVSNILKALQVNTGSAPGTRTQ